MGGRWFLWHLQGGMYHPPINPEVFFQEMLAKARIETLYVQLSRHVRIIKKVSMHIQHFWRIYDIVNVRFLHHLAVFGYSKCFKVHRNS